MRQFSVSSLVAIFFVTTVAFTVSAQEEGPVLFGGLNQIQPGAPVGQVEMRGDVVAATNGFYVQYSNTVLTADSGACNLKSGDVAADGNVRIEDAGMIWMGDHIDYNFKTHQMRSEQFRAGRPPIFVGGEQLSGISGKKGATNEVIARHAFVTSDDISHPLIKIHASKIKIVPDRYVECWNAVVTADGMPAFYFPYYRRNLGSRANNLNFLPGYRTAYGPYLLTSYRWFLNEALDGDVRADYRERRGFAGGPDLNLHLQRWGEMKADYYYLHDLAPNVATNVLTGEEMPKNRQRFYFEWQGTPETNLNLKAMVNYQSDPLVLHDFFEGVYSQDPQPPTFTEVNKYRDNWSLDALTTPRINDFFDQVERIPDVKLTGWRQQIFDTPIYYESESSAGYYRKMFGETNSLFSSTNGPGSDYAAARADTDQQLLLPWTFFNWLNVTPRVGGRFTYYSHETGPGATNRETYRRVFNTGLDTSFKASQLWPDATNSFFQIDGLRHIIEPSASYAFVPRPSAPPSQLPQFDSSLPSPLLLPIQLPDYNDIDSIDSENVIRFGLRNTLQTKRNGEIQNLAEWNLLLDWRLHPHTGQTTFNDLYSDFEFRPRTWIILDSQTRYDINNGWFNLAYHQITLMPNEWWSWSLSHDYTRAGFVDATGDNLVGSTFFLRANDNWGFRTEHDFNAVDGRLQQQFYTVYRDMRSWTGALTFRLLDNGVGPKDYTVAFSVSFKAHPKYGVGSDAVEPYHLVGE